jgi:ribosomal-protein-alanine N-acetyltransferase
MMASNIRERRFQIAPMKEEDLESIMELERLAFRSPWSRQIFEEELHREWAHVDLLRSSEKGGCLLGFVNYWLVRDEVHLLNIAVNPDALRRGHGARLLEHVIGFGHRQHCRYVTLEVRRSNSGAIRLYRKYGFRCVGIRPNYYADNHEDAIVMILELLGRDVDSDDEPRR